MSNLLQRGAEWLQGQLLGSCSGSISIDIGTGSPLVVSAMIGQTPRSKSGAEDVDLIHSDKDFSVSIAAVGEPDREWVVTWNATSWRVVDWSDDDAFAGMVRLRTQKVPT